MTVGERMKARRKSLGISADKVAEALGVSRSTIFRYEKGDIEKVPSEQLEPIADVLNTSVGYLMGWVDDPEWSAPDNFTALLNEDDIACLLRDNRKRNGYSVEQVTQKLRERGISISTKALYGYENKVGKPKLNTFVALCDIYGITNILEALGLSYSVPVSKKHALSDEEYALIDLYRRADESDRQAVRLILRKYETPMSNAPASAG